MTPTSSPTGEPTKRRQSFLGRMLRPQKSPLPSASSKAPAADDSPPPLSQLNLKGYKISAKHKLLNTELASDIRLLLPPRLQLYDDWELVYSFDQDGISLNTLYRNCDPQYQRLKHKQQRGEKAEKGFAEGVVRNMVSFGSPDTRGTRPMSYVLVIQDEKRNKFGCFLNENLKATDHKRYYGNGECFLWKCEYFDKDKLAKSRENDPETRQRFKAFMYTGVNDNIVYSNHDYIAIGSSSGNNGLWIDKSLYLGVSYPCETFGNEILNEHGDTGHKLGKFKIMNMELWRVGDLV